MVLITELFVILYYYVYYYANFYTDVKRIMLFINGFLVLLLKSYFHPADMRALAGTNPLDLLLATTKASCEGIQQMLVMFNIPIDSPTNHYNACSQVRDFTQLCTNLFQTQITLPINSFRLTLMQRVIATILFCCYDVHLDQRDQLVVRYFPSNLHLCPNAMADIKKVIYQAAYSMQQTYNTNFTNNNIVAFLLNLLRCCVVDSCRYTLNTHPQQLPPISLPSIQPQMLTPEVARHHPTHVAPAAIVGPDANPQILPQELILAKFMDNKNLDLQILPPPWYRTCPYQP